LARGLSLASLIAEVDDGRPEDSNLSSALRLHVLQWFKALCLAEPQPNPRGS
jgi:predicted DNA-binding ribbon-helix-helix protein